MKKIKEWLYSEIDNILAIMLISSVLAVGIKLIYIKKIKDVDIIHKEEIVIPSDMDILFEALCFVESTNNTNAIGDGGSSVGVIQIQEDYLKDANRWYGYEKFTLEDRLCPIKSKEIFMAYNELYNPIMSIEKAVKLHNPKANENYRLKVMNRFYKLKLEYYE